MSKLKKNCCKGVLLLVDGNIKDIIIQITKLNNVANKGISFTVFNELSIIDSKLFSILIFIKFI